MTTPTEGRKNVAIYLWPNMFMLDVLVPHQILGLVQELNVYTFARTTDPIQSDTGMKLIADYDLDSVPQPDILLIGGGMVFTFLAAQDHPVGTSLLEADQIDVAKRYIDEAAAKGVDLVLPTDIVVAPAFAADAEPTVVSADAMPDGQMGLDIGPASGKLFADRVRTAKTVFWNGPMGVFEFPAFAAGTRAVAEALTELNGLSVVGGGDSAAAVRALGFADDQFGHISTGGGASLEYLEGKTLPGLEVLA